MDEETTELDSNELGAFFQPKRLTEFVKLVRSGNDTEVANFVDNNAAAFDTLVNLQSESKSLQQICRKWLKSYFLGIGSPCNSTGKYFHSQVCLFRFVTFGPIY